MTEDQLEVSRDGLARLQLAAEDFAHPAIARTGGVVVDKLRALVKEKDVLPKVRKMRAGLLDRLDGPCL